MWPVFLITATLTSSTLRNHTYINVHSLPSVWCSCLLPSSSALFHSFLWLLTLHSSTLPLLTFPYSNHYWLSHPNTSVHLPLLWYTSSLILTLHSSHFLATLISLVFLQFTFSSHLLKACLFIALKPLYWFCQLSLYLQRGVPLHHQLTTALGPEGVILSPCNLVHEHVKRAQRQALSHSSMQTNSSDSIPPPFALALPSTYSAWIALNSFPFTPYSFSTFHNFSPYSLLCWRKTTRQQLRLSYTKLR